MYKSLLLRSGAVILLLLILSGCYLPPGEPVPSLTPTRTATLTLTPVWFPATATPTPLPTQPRTPTPDMRPFQGELILEDAFEPEEDWYTFAGTIGRITFTDDHLTLAVNQPSGMIFAIREVPPLTDFYAELTADVNICRGGDEYGVMVRVSGIRQDHYRFTLTCDGQAKALRIYNNNVVVLAPLQSNPLIPVGFPGQSRLGIWVSGDEIRFFVNDMYLFGVTDPVIEEGTLGLFVRTTGEDPISVNFSELEVRLLAP